MNASATALSVLVRITLTGMLVAAPVQLGRTALDVGTEQAVQQMLRVAAVEVRSGYAEAGTTTRPTPTSAVAVLSAEPLCVVGSSRQHPAPVYYDGHAFAATPCAGTDR